MRKQIPNAITSLNLLCGCVAVIFAVSGDLLNAGIFAFFGIFFDFFDGLAARLLKAQSEIGLQLDSLADMVTSGIVPGIVMLQLLSLSVTGGYFSISGLLEKDSWNATLLNYLPLVGLLIVVASAYRLAKFNLDTRQTTSFIGLPTPANTLLLVSLPLILQFDHTQLAEDIILNKWFLVGLTIVSCFLLNAEVPLFALKFKTWDFKSNAIRYVFLLISVIALILLKFVAIPLIILLYILMSLFWKSSEK